MKTIEKILLALSAENLTESMTAINAQINYYVDNNMDVGGISLIPILDLLEDQDVDSLREKGFILNIDHFKRDVEKFLILAKGDAILYNSHLKKLHRSYHVFRNNYIKGNIHNARTIHKMKAWFKEILLPEYLNQFNRIYTMPETMIKRILVLIQSEVKQLNQEWYEKELGDEINSNYFELLAKNLLERWDNASLPENIKVQLELEKAKITTLDALITHFQENKLAKSAQSMVLEAVIKEISTDITTRKLNVKSALGSQILLVRLNSLVTDNYNTIQPIIENWQNGKYKDSKDVLHQLEAYISNVVKALRVTIITDHQMQFSELAVQAFLEHLQNDSYETDVKQAMVILTADLTKHLLVDRFGNATSKTEKIMSLISENVLSDLHDQWIGGNLPDDENAYLEHKVFSSLNKIDQQVSQQIWMNSNQENTRALVESNKQLKLQVSQLSDTLATLSEQFKALIAKDKAFKVDQTVQSSTTSTVSHGLFG